MDRKKELLKRSQVMIVSCGFLKSGILKKRGFGELFSGGDLGLRGKNGGWCVSLRGLGEIGKGETGENGRKYSKMCEK